MPRTAAELDASKILRMQFESFAHYARYEGGKPESASCFEALAASVDDVLPKLLGAYVERFQKLEDGKIDVALRQSIQQGVWSPASATEYMQRFIVFASETDIFPHH
jgi:hypothetical protein